MFRLLIIFMLISVDQIKIKSNRLKPGSVTANRELTISESGDFYDRIFATRAVSGNYVVMDRGNMQVKLFSADGKFVRSFGEKGQGPGELFLPRTISATADRIIVVQGNKTILFDMNGQHITDIQNEMFGFSGPEILTEANRFFLIQRYSKRNQYMYKIYNYDGKLLRAETNPHYQQNSDTDIAAFQSYNLQAPKSIHRYKSGFIWLRPGEYNFETLTPDFTVINSYSRDFIRVKEDYSDWNDPEDSKLSKEQKAIQDRFRKNHIALTKGFESDLIDILGTWNEFLLIRTASENRNQIRIDVINQQFQLLDILKIESDEILDVKLVEDQILVSAKNDESGPYLEVYRLGMN